MGKLEGKIAIVTGGSRGMGAATVRLFAAEGARVVIADVLEEGRQLADELGEAAVYCKTDVSSEADWNRLVGECTKSFGTPDVLVNNAAIQRFNSILDTGLDEFQKVLNINLIGAFLGMKIVGGEMVRGGRGAIVNISSIDGMRGANGYCAYSASKWALRGLTKVAALEFAPRGVRVNSVHPGAVNTVMGNPVDAPVDEVNKSLTMIPAQRMGGPSEVAAASLFLASDDASYIYGAELAVDGGWTAGIYNTMLVGAPDDADYGARTEAHATTTFLDSAFRAKEGLA